MVIEYRTRELNMGPLPEGAGVLPLGHRGFLKFWFPPALPTRGVSLCADFEEAIPITYIMAGEWLYHSERSAFCA